MSSVCGVGSSEMALVSGSSSLGPFTTLSGRLTVDILRSVRALVWRRRIRRVMMVRISAMALIQPIAMPAMAPGDRCLEGLAARAYLYVKSWFVTALAETPGDAIVVGGTSGRERLLTQGVSPARVDV